MKFILLSAVILGFISHAYGYSCLDFGGSNDAFVCSSEANSCAVYVHTTYEMSCDGFCESHGETCISVDNVEDGSNDCRVTHSDIGCRATRYYQRCKCTKKTGCNGWRATGNCSASGPREVHNDLACGNQIVGGRSGYCDCTRDRTKGFGCAHSAIYCLEECTFGDEGWVYDLVGKGYCRYGDDFRDFIDSETIGELGDCQTACFDNAECNAVSWKPNECNMYRTGPHGQPYTYVTGCPECLCYQFSYRGSWSGIRIGSGFCRGSDGDWNFLIDKGPGISESACQDACLKEPSCIAISWGAEECNLYGKHSAPYVTSASGGSCPSCACSVMQSNGDYLIQILSIEHSSGAVGKYFNYMKADMDGAIGTTSWYNTLQTIDQWRNGSKIRSGVTVRIWRNANGGSEGDAHGRLESGAVSGQFVVGDVLVVL